MFLDVSIPAGLTESSPYQLSADQEAEAHRREHLTRTSLSKSLLTFAT